MRIVLAGVALGVALLLCGCSEVEYRVVDCLPAPVFGDEQVAAVRPVVIPPAPADSSQAARAQPTNPAGKPEAIKAPVADWERHSADNGWKYIIIHHSATPNGSAASFDRTHRQVNKWDELGYHFVIGNGQGCQNGLVEVGSRWRSQKHGAHCKTDDNRYNDFGIGICLVGNFETARPTPAQVASLQKLVSYLADRYQIPTSRILGHSEAVAVTHEHRGTRCPGKYFDMDLFRQAIRATRLASADNARR